ERDAYIALLRRLRAALMPGTHIAITALASWCLDDRWLMRADADEAIAMLFSMGPSGKDILRLLKTRRLETGSPLPLSIGISANETATNEELKRDGVLRNCRRLYIFNSLPWQHR